MCQTWDTPMTLLYLCPSWSLYIYIERERGKRLEHKRDTYLLFIFSFNLEHLSNYILFTLLNLFLTTAYPWCDGHSTSTSACGV